MSNTTTLQDGRSKRSAAVVFSYHPRLTFPAHVRQAQSFETEDAAEEAGPKSGLFLTAGTRLITATGRLSVEKFNVGTKVWTLENGFVPVMEVKRRAIRLSPAQFAQRPVILQRNALGAGAPMRDIRMAPKQALIVDDWTHEPEINKTEKDVTAAQLIERDRAARDLKCKSVTYVWLRFDAPQVVEAEGLLTRVL